MDVVFRLLRPLKVEIFWIESQEMFFTQSTTVSMLATILRFLRTWYLFFFASAWMILLKRKQQDEHEILRKLQKQKTHPSHMYGAHCAGTGAGKLPSNNGQKFAPRTKSIQVFSRREKESYWEFEMSAESEARMPTVMWKNPFGFASLEIQTTQIFSDGIWISKTWSASEYHAVVGCWLFQQKMGSLKEILREHSY